MIISDCDGQKKNLKLANKNHRYRITKSGTVFGSQSISGYRRHALYRVPSVPCSGKTKCFRFFPEHRI